MPPPMAVRSTAGIFLDLAAGHLAVLGQMVGDRITQTMLKSIFMMSIMGH